MIYKIFNKIYQKDSSFRLFMVGQGELLEEVEQEMREAAKNLDFERAMQLRDILFELKAKK